MRWKRSGGMQGLRGNLPTPLGLCQGFCTSSKPLEPLQAERLTLVQQWPWWWSNLSSGKPKLGTSLQESKAQTRAGDAEEGWWHGHPGKGSEPLTTEEPPPASQRVEANLRGPGASASTKETEPENSPLPTVIVTWSLYPSFGAARDVQFVAICSQTC